MFIDNKLNTKPNNKLNTKSYTKPNNKLNTKSNINIGKNILNNKLELFANTLDKIINNDNVLQLCYQILCLLLLGLIYKNNIHILNIIKKSHTNKNRKLSYYLIYYKSFLFSYILVTFAVNYVIFTKSMYNLEGIKYLLLFLILELFIVTIIFNDIDKQVLKLESFINNNIGDLPLYSKSLKYQTNYEDTELPDYVKLQPDKDTRINKPEHYDYTPNNIPQWHMDPELSKKFEALKKSWDADTNKKYRQTIKAFDKYSTPQIDDGFKITHPEHHTKMFNLFEMNREHNKPNKIILQALEEGGYDGKYIHNTEHLRRHNNTELAKLQRYNRTGEYYDPENVFQKLDEFPDPKIEDIQICRKPNTTNDYQSLEDVKKNIIRADLQDEYEPKKYNPNKIYKSQLEKKYNDREYEINNIKKQPPNLTNLSTFDTDNNFTDIKDYAGMEYLYNSDEVNTQVFNKNSGYKLNNTKSKNIIQYCTNYKPANCEQLRMINDNTAYNIFDNK